MLWCVIQYLLAEVAMLSPGVVLDLGCGTGENLLALAECGWECYGVDWSPAAIAQARRAQKSAAVVFYCGDTRDWQPPRLQQFDLVVSTFAIPEGEENARAMLKNGISLLKPGGRILVHEWDKSMEAIWNQDVQDSKQVHNLLLSWRGMKALMADITITKERIYRIPSNEVFPQADDPRRSYQNSMRIACIHGYKPTRRKDSADRYSAIELA